MPPRRQPVAAQPTRAQPRAPPPRPPLARRRGVAIQHNDSDGEEIDLSEVGMEDPNDDDESAGVQSNAATRPSTPSVQVNQIPTRAKGRKKEAVDVWEFFKDEQVTSSNGEHEMKRVCQLCKTTRFTKLTSREAPPARSVLWQYSENTTTGGLRRHLVTHHRATYLDTCQKNNWTVYIAKLASTEGGDSVESGFERPLIPFTQKGLVDHLIKFIVADDQSIYVVECPEFRKLLLFLRDTLQDKDIPRRSKIREAILEAWADAFQELKQELALANGTRDVVVLCRNTVRAIRASGQRIERFENTIEVGNEKEWFGVDKDGDPIILKSLQLLRDVRTRWDSVYFMIQRFLQLRQAIEHFLTNPLNKDIAHLRMTDAEWNQLEDFGAVLMIPHVVQHSLCAEKLPTLASSLPNFEMFMTAWETLGAKHPPLKRYTEIGLKWATKYYRRMDNTKAYVIAMFLNPSFRMAWITSHWDEKYIRQATKTIKETICTLTDNSILKMTEYRQRLPASSTTATNMIAAPRGRGIPSSNPWATATKYDLSEMLQFRQPSQPSIRTIDEEFETYVKELSPQDTDMVLFWDMDGGKRFATLYAMALDYLPIQASAVPCERAFSSASETDTKRRNRLHPTLMEALQILKFSLKQQRLDFMQGLETQEEDMLLPSEDAPDDLAAALQGGSSVDELIRALGDSGDSQTSLETDELE
ncbi:hypothetical protein M378DRAFT_182369 [Amanita muscaria Koide BX008]|uniref:HAT C-terminal dimerisation domain-containing protein n=1 Tax=Amanita muscaria (strain Koide BX008) TaxID=946122 RepID=A0A0C2WFP8_AMAMK|nr:hypothetical protein M378DRAFT_182369 [Amanita muscaria Koide BX008]